LSHEKSEKQENFHKCIKYHLDLEALFSIIAEWAGRNLGNALLHTGEGKDKSSLDFQGHVLGQGKVHKSFTTMTQKGE
jgi:hypothetical protein